MCFFFLKEQEGQGAPIGFKLKANKVQSTKKQSQSLTEKEQQGGA
jgi:hypothetical protein